MDKQVTRLFAEFDIMYPVSQLYVTVPPTRVLVGVPGEPLEMEGGDPQETEGEKHK